MHERPGDVRTPRTVRHLGYSGVRFNTVAVSIAVLSVPNIAQAQESPSTSERANEVTPFVVTTGSRLSRQGFEVPTPTAVIGQDDIELRAPVNAVKLTNQIPSFRPSQTSISRPGFQGSDPVSAGLRRLGNRRTLTRRRYALKKGAAPVARCGPHDRPT